MSEGNDDDTAFRSMLVFYGFFLVFWSALISIVPYVKSISESLPLARIIILVVSFLTSLGMFLISVDLAAASEFLRYPKKTSWGILALGVSAPFASFALIATLFELDIFVILAFLIVQILFLVIIKDTKPTRFSYG